MTTRHPQFGELRMQNVAPRLSATPSSVRTPAPQLGEHNDAIYQGLLGLSTDQLASLRAAGVV